MSDTPSNDIRAFGVVRMVCANWEGDVETGHHTGPCGGDGILEVPSLLELNGEWRQFVINCGGWNISMHHCEEPGDHEVNAGNRFHDNTHELIFCCGPCQLAYLIHMYDEDPLMQMRVLRLCGVKLIPR